MIPAGRPGPSSTTRISTDSPARSALMQTRAGPAWGATPCLIAFSTSGCNKSCGTDVSSTEGSISCETVAGLRTGSA